MGERQNAVWCSFCRLMAYGKRTKYCPFIPFNFPWSGVWTRTSFKDSSGRLQSPSGHAFYFPQSSLTKISREGRMRTMNRVIPVQIHIPVWIHKPYRLLLQLLRRVRANTHTHQWLCRAHHHHLGSGSWNGTSTTQLVVVAFTLSKSTAHWTTNHRSDHTTPTTHTRGHDASRAAKQCLTSKGPNHIYAKRCYHCSGPAIHHLPDLLAIRAECSSGGVDYCRGST